METQSDLDTKSNTDETDKYHSTSPYPLNHTPVPTLQEKKKKNSWKKYPKTIIQRWPLCPYGLQGGGAKNSKVKLKRLFQNSPQTELKNQLQTES